MHKPQPQRFAIVGQGKDASAEFRSHAAADGTARTENPEKRGGNRRSRRAAASRARGSNDGRIVLAR